MGINVMVQVSCHVRVRHISRSLRTAIEEAEYLVLGALLAV